MTAKRTIVVTGGAGFIGANYVLGHLARYPDDRVVVLDALTYAGNLASLEPVAKDPRYRFVKGDITDGNAVEALFKEEHPTQVVHFAAESHVDRSILGPRVFTVTNVLGTQVVLDVSRANHVSRVLMVSTDEVYGSLGPTGQFTETTPLDPSSPYSASKAAADLVTLAYHRTFKTDVVVTRCSNNYGPLQFPEKLIPLMIINALEDKQLPVYGDGKQIRDWLHVFDHCEAIDVVLDRGKSGEVYNIGGNNEQYNIDIVKMILSGLSKPESLIRHVTDRPGHDRRYAIDASKILRELEWKPKHKFPDALHETIAWYLDNRTWWERIRSGQYQKFYEEQYATRLA